MTSLRLKAEERFGQRQKPGLGLKQGLEVGERVRADKTTKLRQLRLAKEAEDAAEKQAAKDIKAAGKGAFKKPPKAGCV